MNSRQIMVCFVRSDSSVLQESWLNSAASLLAPMTARNGKPYIHAELLFVPKNNGLQNKTDVYGEACSIVYSGKVHLCKKRFSRKEWEFRSIECSEKQYKKMKDFCKDHVSDGFNHLGYFMYWSGPFAPKPTFYTWFGMSPRWYCSEIVIAALKVGGILDDSFPTAEHPDRLYHFIKERSMMNCGRNMKEVHLQFV